MKIHLPAGLALLLMLSSLGHVLAAGFCPRVFGRECCFAKTAGHAPSSSSAHENMATHGMNMDGVNMDGMAMNVEAMAMGETSADRMAINDMIDVPTVGTTIPFSVPGSTKEAETNTIDQPAGSCAHCVGHSGIMNAPVSFVSVSSQSGKEFGSVILPVSKLSVRPVIALAQIVLPKEHSPPESSAARHILINVFLI